MAKEKGSKGDLIQWVSTGTGGGSIQWVGLRLFPRVSVSVHSPSCHSPDCHRLAWGSRVGGALGLTWCLPNRSGWRETHGLRCVYIFPRAAAV